MQPAALAASLEIRLEHPSIPTPLPQLAPPPLFSLFCSLPSSNGAIEEMWIHSVAGLGVDWRASLIPCHSHSSLMGTHAPGPLSSSILFPSWQASPLCHYPHPTPSTRFGNFVSVDRKKRPIYKFNTQSWRATPALSASRQREKRNLPMEWRKGGGGVCAGAKTSSYIDFHKALIETFIQICASLNKRFLFSAPWTNRLIWKHKFARMVVQVRVEGEGQHPAETQIVIVFSKSIICKA